MIGRWHDIASRRGVGVFEATDAAALHHYLGQWSPFMDIEVSPVLDDEESAAVAKQLMADHGA